MNWYKCSQIVNNGNIDLNNQINDILNDVRTAANMAIDLSVKIDNSQYKECMAVVSKIQDSQYKLASLVGQLSATGI